MQCTEWNGGSPLAGAPHRTPPRLNSMVFREALPAIPYRRLPARRDRVAVDQLPPLVLDPQLAAALVPDDLTGAVDRFFLRLRVGAGLLMKLLYHVPAAAL